MQTHVDAYAVINNFAFFAMHKRTMEAIGYADERYVSPHGAHDNDYVARLNEGNICTVLGHNKDHDWRSAEEGNKRGSGSGNDRFIHLYAKMHGGWVPSEEQKINLIKKPFLNSNWFGMKWEKVPEDTGVMDRPPFKGYYLKRTVQEEPDWYGQSS